MTATVFRVSWGTPRQARGAARGRVMRALTTLREWRRRAKGRRELARLDERMLRDIGVTRAEAVFLSSKPFWKE
jgi:uncharacterized protein YjiS (DUF1127 family)